MKTATGRDVVLSLLEMAEDFSRWNKQNTTKKVLIHKLEELGLTLHQFEVLGFMHQNPEFDTVSQLAGELYISKGSLSLMISKLEAAGFLQKKSPEGSDDGRKVYVTLTEKAVSAVEEIKEVVVSEAAISFEYMDAAQRTLFYTKVNELKELFNTGGWKE